MNADELKSKIANPAVSPEDHAAALRQLNALESPSPEFAAEGTINRLTQKLLYDTHAPTLGEVPHHAIHNFLTELGIATPDATNLYQRWLHESPAAQRKMKQMEVHLANSFFDQQDVLAARLQSATDKGLDATAIRREMKRLYQDWVDSSIFNEHPEIRQMMRDVIAKRL